MSLKRASIKTPTNECEMSDCESEQREAFSHCYECKRFACADCHSLFNGCTVDNLFQRFCFACFDEVEARRSAEAKELELCIESQENALVLHRAELARVERVVRDILSQKEDIEVTMTFCEAQICDLKRNRAQYYWSK